LLDIEGALVIVGNLGDMDGFSTLPLILGRRRITGSPSGGIAQTQEMLNFCAQKGFTRSARSSRSSRLTRRLNAWNGER
jgi:D-arabinose 1-dehydrogenase-like Zn-dependent alcohol dehydrogenase